MKHIYIVFFILIAVCCFSISKGNSAQEVVNLDGRFFVSLQDIPLMPGLVELADQTLVFDKPEGRIIEVVSYIQGISFDEIMSYYESVLPQFGWIKTGEKFFVRGDELLQMCFENHEGQVFLRITVMPK
ncbi:MAG: hypothetical protein KAJ86_03885 [Alphaproteobacteria bacterium]|nr:hypothetical protein [Alphaproteobacteria bacterium]